MDLKLIEKLARLANNNPNEHEANAAARKVCKLLQEDNFNFSLNIERTTEPQFKSTKPDPIPYNDIFDHLYKRAEEFYKKDPFFNMEYKYGEQQKKSKDEFRERTCVDCGATVKTRRITNIFRCDSCEWISHIKPFTDHL